MNKPTSWPKRLRRCIHLALQFLLEMPSDFSGINIVKKEYPLLQSWLLVNLGRFYFLSYLGWRECHVLKSSPDMIICRLICLRLDWLMHRSALYVNPCQ
ncbi:hypothetical protein TNCV_476861 [Trichonephila clavipes]|nr:hypothetical protein TNCV_476861 [Trichonephila clavipes]